MFWMWNRKKKVSPMAAVIGTGNWASELSEAFGENPGDVRSLTLKVVVHEPVVVTIEKFVDKDNTDVIEIIKKLAWREDTNDN